MIKMIFVSAFIMSGVASAAPMTCKDLILSSAAAYTCSTNGSDGSVRTDVSIQFQASTNPSLNIFDATYTFDGQQTEFYCFCKSAGTVKRPSFFTTKEVVCNVKNSVSGAIGSFSAKVGGKGGAKLSKFHGAITHSLLEPGSVLGQCSRIP